MFAVFSVAHALIVLLIWLAEVYLGASMLSGRTWLILAWLWLVWPFLLAMHPDGSRRRVIVHILMGIVLLAPCVGSIFLFTMWVLEH